MSQIWKDDEELFALIRKDLFSAVVGDVMDKMGFLHQFLSPQIQPLRPDMRVIGRTMTVLEADVFVDRAEESANPLLKQPFGLMLRALDDLKPHEVYLATGASPHYALWGELMTTRARHLGAVGTVLDGYCRDTFGILAQNFPTFSYGSYAQDQGARGKVIDYRVPVEISGVRIHSGDLIIGDVDGVCLVPQKHEKDIIAAALEKAKGEKTVQNAIEAGMSATEAWHKYGIL